MTKSLDGLGLPDSYMLVWMKTALKWNDLFQADFWHTGHFVGFRKENIKRKHFI